VRQQIKTQQYRGIYAGSFSLLSFLLAFPHFHADRELDLMATAALRRGTKKKEW